MSGVDITALTTWVDTAKGGLDTAIGALTTGTGGFDVQSMLTAQTKMNEFQQAVQFTTDVSAGLHTASMSVARNAKG
jgi:hypothetical protein